MEPGPAELHEALERAWEQLAGVFEGARFDRRPGHWLAVFPGVPFPQFNGPWIDEDSTAVAEALPAAIAEVDAVGELPWVQTRPGQTRVQEAARALGLTHSELVPGMVVTAAGFKEPDVSVEVGEVAPGEFDETNQVLAEAFDAPPEMFDRIGRTVLRLPGVRLFAGRVDGEIVTSSLGYTVDGATGIFQVGTPARHRGRGYAAAVTAHAVRDGFDQGARFAYLQSSELGHGVYRKLGFRDVEEYVLLGRPDAS